MSASTLATIFASSQSFFARPQHQKDSLAWTTPRSNRGYVATGREKASHSHDRDVVARERAGNPDLKESFEIGREGVAGCPNRWPDGLDAEGARFRVLMQGFFLECKRMHRLIMMAIALGMGLEEDFFDEFVGVGDNNLRLLHYPAVAKAVFRRNRGQVRAGAHTDYGSVTLLWQDMRGGLQVQRGKGEWADVRPMEGTVVVNAGDLLARWSNDLIRSTTHRVVEPPATGPTTEDGEGEGDEDEEHPARYSVVYFCNPDYHKLIEALPGTWEDRVGGKKYGGICSGEYLVQRLSTTY